MNVNPADVFGLERKLSNLYSELTEMTGWCDQHGAYSWIVSISVPKLKELRAVVEECHSMTIEILDSAQ